MIRTYDHADGQLRPATGDGGPGDGALWLDLENPDAAELELASASLGVPLPPREEMQEIELSSRLYHEHGADYVTVMVPASADGDNPVIAPVTFVLAPGRLATIRYHNPRPFETYPRRASRTTYGCARGDAVLLGLFEEIIDRLADILERISRDLEGLSRDLFRAPAGKLLKSAELQALLGAIGRKGDMVGDIRLCLLTLDRALAYLGATLAERKAAAGIRSALKIESRDVRSLTEHCDFLSQKTSLMLDATLGLVTTEQNQIIKIFSVAAAAFLPPTLIASIYGMNFRHMPELDTPWGYPVAIGLMILSAILPLLYFRRRGWL